MSDSKKKAAETPGAAWDGFVDKLIANIADAEKHLGVEHGTLADARHDSDYLFVLKLYAAIEALLNDLLKENVTRALTHPKVYFVGGDALGDFLLNRSINEKRKLALEFKLITVDHSGFIQALAEIRNKYAHDIKNFSLAIIDVAKLLNHPLESFLQRLCAAKLKNGKLEDRPAIIRLLVYFRFADFIGTAMTGIRPLEPFGLLFGTGDVPQPLPPSVPEPESE